MKRSDSDHSNVYIAILFGQILIYPDVLSERVREGTKKSPTIKERERILDSFKSFSFQIYPISHTLLTYSGRFSIAHSL